MAYEWVVNDTLDDDYHCFVHFTSGASQTGDEIVLQQDHAPPTPTSQWQPGQTITDGPYEIEVPGDKFDTYDLVIGLHKGPRVPLKGLDAGAARILIGRLLLERDGDRITDTTLADLNAEREAYQSTRADFGVNLNPEGTRVDFGTIATDGSVKVNRGEDGLVVFPYPRDKEFTVALDLKALAGRSVDAGGAKVTALAALTLEDLGDVPTEVTDGRLVFSVGLEGAGRYRVAW